MEAAALAVVTVPMAHLGEDLRTLARPCRSSQNVLESKTRCRSQMRASTYGRCTALRRVMRHRSHSPT